MALLSKRKNRFKNALDDNQETGRAGQFTVAHHSDQSPVFSTFTKASCGMLTLPTIFMRFLPSFLLSVEELAFAADAGMPWPL